MCKHVPFKAELERHNVDVVRIKIVIFDILAGMLIVGNFLLHEALKNGCFSRTSKVGRSLGDSRIMFRKRSSAWCCSTAVSLSKTGKDAASHL
jgi:hypothetical protein